MVVVRRSPSSASRRLAATLLGVLAVAGLTAASCSESPTNIALGNASRSDVTEVVDASATVTAKGVATLTAPADGTLTALSVQPGQTVAAGQVLAVVGSPAATDRLAQARSALDALSGGGGGFSTGNLLAVQKRSEQDAALSFKQARDQAGGVTDEHQRTALLAQIDAGEKSYQNAAAGAREVVNAVQRGFAGIGQAMSALTAAQRIQAQSAYDVARATVDALTLRAPIAGVVQLGGPGTGSSGPSLTDLLGAAGGGLPGAPPGAGAANTGQSGGSATGPGIDSAVLPGARVSAGTPVVTVVDTSELGLMADVDETDVLLVTPGVTASVELDAAPGARYDGVVRSVDLLPGTSARGGVSYRVRLSVGAGKYGDDRAAPAPRPGMSAVAHLAVRAAKDAVAVPAAAVFNAGGKDTVWVVRDGRAARIPVTVGVSGQDLVQVTAGVQTGDRIVVKGADEVKPGQRLP
jgi:multidrug efflux pump subunit AcrA (membrane-fusion protein)